MTIADRTPFLWRSPVLRIARIIIGRFGWIELDFFLFGGVIIVLHYRRLHISTLQDTQVVFLCNLMSLNAMF